MHQGHSQGSPHPSPSLVYIPCAGEGSSTGRNREPTCSSRIAAWPDGVRSHLQEVTEHIKKKEKERERQLVTSSSKYFGMPPAILQKWPQACPTLCSCFSQLGWDGSPATPTALSPCPGLTLRSWKTHELQQGWGPLKLTLSSTPERMDGNG